MHRPLVGLQRELGRFLGDLLGFGQAALEIRRQRELREDHRGRPLVTARDRVFVGVV